MLGEIEKFVNESIDVFQLFFRERKNQEQIAAVASSIVDAIKRGGKILVFGNGGSAADSQHFSAEMVVRFKSQRRALPCIALTCDTSILTAHANDYSFDTVFSRQIEALASKGDVAFAISTSGESPNIVRGAETALDRGMHVVALTGGGGGSLAGIADSSIIIPSSNTAIVQQGHITVIHLLCDLIEEAFSAEDGQ